MTSKTTSILLASVAALSLGHPAFAQNESTTGTGAVQADSATDATDAQATTETDQEVLPEDQEALLTEEELDDLTAPIALYPDTLLIQVLVAATFPIDVIKANRFVQDNADLAQEELNAAVDAEGYDPSVAVLAQGFPTVLENMADHIDWTELAGNAMLAQSEDVMASIQRLREQAEEFGNLETNEEQVVTRDETDSIVIQPADPQYVYVPTYDHNHVYYRYDPLIAFTSVIVIGAIWHNNNYWSGYWGCRNCGGWGGRPIYNRPDIDIDGNVNIGNSINIGDRENNFGDRNNNIGDRDNNIGDRGDGSWKPDQKKQDRAKENIGDRKANPQKGGKTDRPLAAQSGGRGDDLRRDLSKQTGTRDISKPSAGRTDRTRPSTGAAKTRPSTSGKAKPSTKRTPTKTNRSTSTKKKVSKPTKSRQPTKSTKSRSSSSAFKSHGGGKSTRSSKSRGHSSRKPAHHRGGGKKRR